MVRFVRAVAWGSPLLLPLCLSAAPIAWRPAVDTTGKTQLVEGMVVSAFSGGAGATVTGAGASGTLSVVFTGGSYRDLSFSPAPGERTSLDAGDGAPSSGDAAFDAVTGSFTDTQSGIVSGIQTLGGLTPGESYRVQVFFNDQRPGMTGRVMRYGDGQGNTVDVAAGGSGRGQHAVGDFTADAETQTLSHEALGFGNAHVTAILLVRPGPPPVPDPPRNLSAFESDRQVTLDWDDITLYGFQTFRVYRSGTSGGPYSLLASPSASTYADTGLVNGSSYFYVVTAVNVNGGESALSVEVEGVPRDVVDPPNFLIIITDDQDTFSVGAYRRLEASETAADGSAYGIRTPNIDRLADEGMLFLQARIMGADAAAVCQPSRTSFMTGRGVWRNTVGVTAAVTLPGVFNRGVRDGRPDLPHATYRTCKEGNSYPTANAEFTMVADSTKRGNTDGSGSEWHADRALEFLEHWRTIHRPAGTPFLMYLGFSHPHDVRSARPDLAARYGAVNTSNPGSIVPNASAPPLPASHLPVDPARGTPANWPFHPFDNSHLDVRDEQSASGIGTYRTEAVVRNEIGRHFACVDWIDTQVGRVLARLEDPNGDGDPSDSVLDNTYIVFTSDHGIAIGRHGLQGKQNLYDHTWRVPYIVRGPGVPAGAVSDALIYLHDTFPTLVDLAGLTPPPTWDAADGQSFRPVLAGAADAHREVLYGLYAGGATPGIRAVTDGRFKLIRTQTGPDAPAVTQLFDLEENPFELLPEHGVPNLADRIAYAGIRRRLEEALQAERARNGDPHRLAGDRVGWRFEGDFQDRMPGGLDGMGRGSPQPVFASDAPGAEDGLFGEANGQSLALDSTLSQFVEVADAELLDAGGRPFTLQAWVKPAAMSSGPTEAGRLPVFHKAGDYSFYAALGDLGGASDFNKLGLRLGGAVVVSTLSLPGTGWHHVSVAFDPATDTVRFTLNGTVDARSSSASGTAGSAPLWIGADEAGFFDGRIDEAGITAGALAPSELRPLSAAPEPGAFRIEDLAPMGKGVAIRFGSDERLLYDVYMTENLNTADWKRIRSDLGGRPGASDTTVETDGTGTRRFYRVTSRRPR